MKINEKKTKEAICPNCGKVYWDKVTIDQAINKCWNCGMKWITTS